MLDTLGALIFFLLFSCVGVHVCRDALDYPTRKRERGKKKKNNSET